MKSRFEEAIKLADELKRGSGKKLLKDLRELDKIRHGTPKSRRVR